MSEAIILMWGTTLGVVIALSIVWLTEVQKWRQLVRAYMEQRVKKPLVIDEDPGADPVSSLTLPPDLAAELAWRRQQEEENG